MRTYFISDNFKRQKTCFENSAKQCFSSRFFLGNYSRNYWDIYKSKEEMKKAIQYMRPFSPSYFRLGDENNCVFFVNIEALLNGRLSRKKRACIVDKYFTFGISFRGTGLRDNLFLVVIVSPYTQIVPWMPRWTCIYIKNKMIVHNNNNSTQQQQKLYTNK